MDDQWSARGAPSGLPPVEQLEQALSSLQATLQHIEQVLNARQCATERQSEETQSDRRLAS
jgi:hypothetical protein